MANVNNPRGLLPVRYLDGNDWNMGGNMYYIPQADGSAYYPGDLVKSAAVSDANGVMGIQKALGTDTIRGVVVGVFLATPYNPSLNGTVLDNSLQYVPASKSRPYYVLVCDDPSIMFEVVDDGLSVLTATAVNKNCSITVAAPASPQQMSASVLLTSSVATTQTLNFRIMGLVQRDDNTFGQYAHWLVRPNQHELMGNTAGV